MTLLDQARRGRITPEMEMVATEEQLSPEAIRQRIADGTVVLPANVRRSGYLKQRTYQGVGAGLTTKVSASIGTGKDSPDAPAELAKLQIALESGTHTIMDLSIGGDLDAIRREILMASPVPVGTLPIYQTCMEASLRDGILAMTSDQMIADIEKQARDGVDFMGLHCAMTTETLRVAKTQGRLNDVVSWGGSLLAGWMLHHQVENPLYTRFDDILDIARTYEVTLSLADGLRPGCIGDSLDRAQVQELIILGELVDRARAAGVQIMIKGPGHAPLPHLATTVQLMKQMCKGAPYFVFGPVVADIAPGYDHITAAIGGAMSAAAGADFLCYVTPAEHVAFPSEEDVRVGVKTALVAAHIADLAKGHQGAWEHNTKMAKARLPWDVTAQQQLAIDPNKLQTTEPSMEGAHHCTRCGDQCSMRVISQYFNRPHSCC